MGAPSQPGFSLGQTFFGFRPQDQVELHRRLFELLSAGEGRWTWDDIYNLPIRIRRLWISIINKEREERAEKQSQPNNSKSPPRAPVFKK